MARSCYIVALRPDGVGGQVLPIEDMDARENKKRRGKPADDLIPIPLIPEEPDKVTYIGESLPQTLKDELVKFLQENNDVFAWSAVDMPGIDPELITHKLNVNPTRITVKQKKRNFAPERQEAIKKKSTRFWWLVLSKRYNFPNG